jgi:hypothetical protein
MENGENAARQDTSARHDWGKWRDYRAMRFGSFRDRDLVACGTCGRPTEKTGTRRCDGCWEVEHRVRGYLADGGLAAAAFLVEVLFDAARRIE